MNSVQQQREHCHQKLLIKSFHLSGHTFRFCWTVQDLEVFLVKSNSPLVLIFLPVPVPLTLCPTASKTRHSLINVVAIKLLLYCRYKFQALLPTVQHVKGPMINSTLHHSCIGCCLGSLFIVYGKFHWGFEFFFITVHVDMFVSGQYTVGPHFASFYSLFSFLASHFCIHFWLRECFQKSESVPIIRIGTEPNSDCGKSEVFCRPQSEKNISNGTQY